MFFINSYKSSLSNLTFFNLVALICLKQWFVYFYISFLCLDHIKLCSKHIETAKKRNYHINMSTEEEIKKNFGKNVRELRLQKSLTQEKLAEYIGIQAQTVTAIENGKTFISCEVLAALSDFFSVDVSVLFSPNISINNEETKNYISKIKSLLPKFSSGKLEEIYNMLLVCINLSLLVVQYIEHYLL